MAEETLKEPEERFKKIEDNIARILESVAPPEKRFVSDIIGRFVDEIAKVLKVSKDAAQALLLVAPTFLAIYLARRQPIEIPSSFEGFITRLLIYLLPITYLLYFSFLLAQKIEKVNRFWKRHIQKKSADLAHDDIISGKTLHYDIDLYLSTIKFRPEQLINIIKYLRDTKQFLPKFQLSLMNNSENIVTNPGIYPYIKESILNDEWNSGAVCNFINKMENQLNNEYLVRLCTKYQQYPSVLFVVGSLQHYKSYKEEQKIVNAGYNFKKHGKWSGSYRKIKLIMDIFAFGLFSIVIYETYTLITLIFAGLLSESQFNDKVTYIAFSLAVVFFLGMFKQSNFNDIIYKNAIKRDIENILKKEQITFTTPKELDFFVEDIVVAID